MLKPTIIEVKKKEEKPVVKDARKDVSPFWRGGTYVCAVVSPLISKARAKTTIR